LDENENVAQPPTASTDSDVEEFIFDVRYTIRRNDAEQRRLRHMILELSESAGVTQRELARRIGIPHGTLTRWIQTARQERGDRGELR